jgi:hypothetical protein
MICPFRVRLRFIFLIDLLVLKITQTGNLFFFINSILNERSYYVVSFVCYFIELLA